MLILKRDRKTMIMYHNNKTVVHRPDKTFEFYNITAETAFALDTYEYKNVITKVYIYLPGLFRICLKNIRA